MLIVYHLPHDILDNAALVREYPDWTEEKIFSKTGIASRHVSAAGEDALDLAAAACEKLFCAGVDRASVDFVLLCTQSPRYRLPSSACILQHRLGLPTSAGALDFDLGCSGFVYGLSLAKGLVTSGAAKGVLLVTAETYTKYLGVEGDVNDALKAGRNKDFDCSALRHDFTFSIVAESFAAACKKD